MFSDVIEEKLTIFKGLKTLHSDIQAEVV